MRLRIVLSFLASALTAERAEKLNLAGGEKLLSEELKHWMTDEKADVTVFTSEGVARAMTKLGLAADFEAVTKRMNLKDSLMRTKSGVAIYYLLSLVSALMIRSNSYYEIARTSTPYFPDVLHIWWLSTVKRRASHKVVLINHVFPEPFVRTRYSSRFASYASWMQQIVMISLVRKAKFHVFTHEHYVDWLRRQGIPAARIHTIELGVDSEPPHHAPDQEKTRYDAVMIGRLDKKKGALDIVRIWKKVVDARPNSKLCIIGRVADGSFVDEIKQSNLNANILVMGAVSEERKNELLASAGVFVLPSYEEGWSLALGEALAAGKPAVVYDLPPFRQYDPQVVRKVRVGDISNFAACVLSLLTAVDSDQGIAISEKAKSQVKSWAQVTKDDFEQMRKIVDLVGNR